jgi:hypothetical protein
MVTLGPWAPPLQATSKTIDKHMTRSKPILVIGLDTNLSPLTTNLEGELFGNAQ